jgi:hypothetical protein
MKKTIEFVLIIFAGLAFSSVAFADWAVTVTWTHSIGPNLATEDCVMDGVVMKTVAAIDAPTCTFNVTELKNQKIEIISKNIQGAQNGFTVGTLFTAPAPASNGSISTHWFQP